MTDEIKSVDDVTKKLEQDRIDESKPKYPNEIKPVEGIPEPAQVDDTVGFLDLFKWDLIESIKTDFLSQVEGKGRNMSLSSTITSFIVQLVLKAGGGFLLAHGISQSSVTEITGAIVSIVGGLLVSLLHHTVLSSKIDPPLK